MKKFLICFVVLTVGFSCTKEQLICGCSPIDNHFSLIIKNQQNVDLLDPSVSGSFNKTDIKIRYKQKNVLKDVTFSIREPFSYGNAGTKFPNWRKYAVLI